MARPRTLGPNITFRLPLPLHNLAVERAEANGETVDQYVRRHITDALQRLATPPPAPSRQAKLVDPQWKTPPKPKR